jgi:PPM family protein phosphatase
MAVAYEHAVAFASAGKNSQEAFRILRRDGVLIVALADGGGGMRSGVTASRAFASVVDAAVVDTGFPLEDADAWLGVFRAMDTRLAANRAGETTGIVVVIGGRRLVGISTGDCGAWVIAPTTIDDLTAGQYTQQRLGSSHATPTMFERASPEGVLLVASDGLFKFAAGEVIADVIRAHPIGEATQKLVQLVRLRSGHVPEDVMVVLVGPSA